MPNPGASVAELAAQLQKALDTALAQNERLAQQIEQAEQRAAAAESRAADVQSKLSILETLKTKQYQTVVTELFDAPSKRAARLTLLIAIASILIGLTQTIVSSVYSARANSLMLQQLTTSIRTQVRKDIDDSAVRTKNEIDGKLRDLSRDGSSPSQALRLSPGQIVSSEVALKAYKYYEINLPSGVTKIAATLRSISGDADLRVLLRGSDSEPMSTTPPITSTSGLTNKPSKKPFNPNSCSSGSSTPYDQCSVANPRPGTWIVRVYGYTSSRFELAVTVE